jgi:transposase-like protein
MNHERANYWRQIIGRQERSGLSVKAFCRQEELCAHSLYLWRRRLNQRQAESFAVLEVKPDPSECVALEVTLANGDRVRIPSGVDGGTLRSVIAALRGHA